MKKENFWKSPPLCFRIRTNALISDYAYSSRNISKGLILFNQYSQTLLPGGSTVLWNKRPKSFYQGKPVQGIYATSCAEWEQNRLAGRVYIWQACNSFQPKESIRPLKERGACVCKEPGREENNLSGKRRKEVYLRVKYCGPLKGTERGTQSRDKCFDENTDEIKNNCNLIKVVNFIYLYSFFLIVKREECIKVLTYQIFTKSATPQSLQIITCIRVHTSCHFGIAHFL